MADIYPDFVAAYLGSIDGTEVLGHTVTSYLILTRVDPPKNGVIVHGESIDPQIGSIDKRDRVRISIYGPSLPTTKQIAEVLHAAVLGHGIEFGPSDFSPDATFFDSVRSEQAPVLNQSPGLSSICFTFEVAATSRPL